MNPFRLPPTIAIRQVPFRKQLFTVKRSAVDIDCFFSPLGEALKCNFCESELSFEDCDKNMKHVECAKEFALDNCVKTHIKAFGFTEEKYIRKCQTAAECNKPTCKGPGDDKCEVYCCTSDNCNRSSVLTVSSITLFICTLLSFSIN